MCTKQCTVHKSCAKTAKFGTKKKKSKRLVGLPLSTPCPVLRSFASQRNLPRNNERAQGRVLGAYTMDAEFFFFTKKALTHTYRNRDRLFFPFRELISLPREHLQYDRKGSVFYVVPQTRRHRYSFFQGILELSKSTVMGRLGQQSLELYLRQGGASRKPGVLELMLLQLLHCFPPPPRVSYLTGVLLLRTSRAWLTVKPRPWE